MTFCIQPFLKAIISKSKNIEKFVYRKRISHILPNGVNLAEFDYDENDYRDELKLKCDGKYVLFLGNPLNIRKNFELAKESCTEVGRKDLELIAPYPIPHENVHKYLKSVNVLVLTSFAEGSPNVIKEAMACDCPIVSTRVGDVEWLMNDLEGCYISGFQPEKFSAAIIKALDFSETIGRTKGREQLYKLKLDADSVALKLISIYEGMLSGK